MRAIEVCGTANRWTVQCRRSDTAVTWWPYTHEYRVTYYRLNLLLETSCAAGFSALYFDNCMILFYVVLYVFFYFFIIICPHRTPFVANDQTTFFAFSPYLRHADEEAPSTIARADDATKKPLCIKKRLSVKKKKNINQHGLTYRKTLETNAAQT